MLALDIRSFDQCVEWLRIQGIGFMPDVLSVSLRKALLTELSSYHMEKAPEEVGRYRVRQNFRCLTNFRRGSLFLTLRDGLEDWLNTAFAKRYPHHLSRPLHFTDAVVQTYDTSDVGISPHRDGARYGNLIVIAVLEGAARFCVCADREGRHAAQLRNDPGDLILMRAPGYLGEDVQPFHFVDRITARRSTFALRAEY